MYQRLEACQQTAALIDDDGDGLGSRLSPYAPGSTDGALAQKTYLKDLHLDTAPELVEAYRRAIEEVEALIQKRETIEDEEYYRQLESLLLELARYNQQIRQAER